MTPPRLANRLLRLVVRHDDFEAISGDFEEALRTEIAQTHGRVRAALRYWRQVVRVVVRTTAARLRDDGLADPNQDPHRPKGTSMAAIGAAGDHRRGVLANSSLATSR